MQQKKLSLINEDTEDLLNKLDALEEDDAETTVENYKTSTDEAYQFLTRFKLKAGNVKVSKQDLYSVYKQTTPQHKGYKIFYSKLRNSVEVDNRFVYLNNDLAQIIQTLPRQVDNNKDALSGYLLKKYERFMKEMSIQDGHDIYISAKALYFFFDKWQYDNKFKQTNYVIFNKLTNVYLTHTKQLSNNLSYGIDKGFYEKVSQEDIKKAKEWAKKFKPQKQS